MEVPQGDQIQPEDERVLVVEDDKVLCDLLEEALSGRGFNVHTAPTGEAAFQMLADDSFSLVIADVHLPNMNGLELIRRIKAQSDDIRIIVMSGKADIDYPIQSLRAGAHDYFAKPFKLKEVLESVDHRLEERRLYLRGKHFEEFLQQRVCEATQNMEQANQKLEKTNRKLTETKEFLENILEHSPDAIIISDENGTITYGSRSAGAMTGFDRGQLVGKPVANLFVGGPLEARRLSQTLSEKKSIQNYDTEFIRKDGETFAVSLSASLLYGSDGGKMGMVCICKDVTEQKQLEENLRELSIQDNLTGLYNQRHFYERLTKEMERARRQKHPLCLILFDVDNFKNYNDTRGHLEGDVVLQEVGALVRKSIRDGVDSGYRYGGDEFTVIVSEAGKKQALQMAERMRSGFEGTASGQVSLSVGLVQWEPEMSVKDLIHKADQAMYIAKRDGGNRILVAESSEQAPEHSA